MNLFNRIRYLDVWISGYLDTWISGYLDIQDLDAVFRKVLTRAGAHRVNEAAAREMVEQADSDGNEVLDYSEFEKLWSQIRSDTEVR